MKKERMLEELSLIEGFTFTEKMEHNTYPYGWTVRVKTWFDRLNNKVPCSDLPDYLNDHNACQRLLDGMTNPQLSRYWGELRELLGIKTGEVDWTFGMRMAQATCLQKCETILKAYGKWED